MKNPWLKFYPADWRADPALRMCSLAARGLWMEMLCLMHDANPQGSLVVNGRPVTDKQLASLSGSTIAGVVSALGELEEAGVFSRDDDRTIYSRRMRRDIVKAERDQANGRGGGNPNLKRGVNPPDKGGDKAQKQKLEAEADRSSLRSERAGAGEPEPFDRWWEACPHKVGKDDARKAFDRIIRDERATVDELVAGMEAYRRAKPPDRQWCNPATWLNQGRWTDQPADALPLMGGHGARASPANGSAALRPTSGSASALAGVAAAVNAHREAS